MYHSLSTNSHSVIFLFCLVSFACLFSLPSALFQALTETNPPSINWPHSIVTLPVHYTLSLNVLMHTDRPWLIVLSRIWRNMIKTIQTENWGKLHIYNFQKFETFSKLNHAEYGIHPAFNISKTELGMSTWYVLIMKLDNIFNLYILNILVYFLATNSCQFIFLSAILHLKALVIFLNKQSSS